ncbi:MAG: hypothetical protein U0X20_03360 [Caldilineaceae bacterium]
MMEMVSGESGVLRTALGVVLGMEGIDARVRLYLWSGGVEDVTLPTVNAKPIPVGAQVVVTFLSDRTASGMVLGTLEGLLSWRRTAPPAFAERMQPQLRETMARCSGLDPVLTVVENAFTLDPDEGQGLFGAAVVMADGRVFFVPGQAGAGTAVIKPHIWDPHTGSMHQVEVPWTAGGGDEFLSGCLLLDGRVFLMPSWANLNGQAYVYDPELDRIGPAGEPVVSGYGSCVLLPDGRVLLVPWSATNPLIYDPKRDAITTSAASTPAELQTGADFTGGVLLPDGRVLLVPNNAPAALVYDPAAENVVVVAGDLGGACCGGGVLLPDGRVLLPINFGLGKTAIFDPTTETISVTTPSSAAGGFAGGALLADGTVLLLPGTYGDLLECRIWNPATDTYTPAPELATVPASALGAYLSGCVLPDGRVVFTPWYSRHLVVWEPGLGASFGRDSALSGFWNHWP